MIRRSISTLLKSLLPALIVAFIVGTPLVAQEDSINAQAFQILEEQKEKAGSSQGLVAAVLMTETENFKLEPVQGTIAKGLSKKSADFQGPNALTTTGDSRAKMLFAFEGLYFSNSVYLVKFQVVKDLRRLQLGRARVPKFVTSGTPMEGYGGPSDSVAPHPNLIWPTQIREVSKGIYEIMPEKPLEPGQYGIYYGAPFQIPDDMVVVIKGKVMTKESEKAVAFDFTVLPPSKD